MFAGARWVATRDCKAAPPENALFGDPARGSFLATYWVLPGMQAAWDEWAAAEYAKTPADRLFAARDHIHTAMYRFRWDARTEDAPPPATALDHGFAGVIAIASVAPADWLADWSRKHLSNEMHLLVALASGAHDHDDNRRGRPRAVARLLPRRPASACGATKWRPHCPRCRAWASRARSSAPFPAPTRTSTTSSDEHEPHDAARRPARRRRRVRRRARCDARGVAARRDPTGRPLARRGSHRPCRRRADAERTGRDRGLVRRVAGRRHLRPAQPARAPGRTASARSRRPVCRLWSRRRHSQNRSRESATPSKVRRSRSCDAGPENRARSHPTMRSCSSPPARRAHPKQSCSVTTRSSPCSTR